MPVRLWGGLWEGGGAVSTVDLRVLPMSGHGKILVITTMNPAGREVTKAIICDAAPSV